MVITRSGTTSGTGKPDRKTTSGGKENTGITKKRQKKASSAKAEFTSSKPHSTADRHHPEAPVLSKPQQQQVRHHLHTFLVPLKAASTICPSQVARRLNEVDPKSYPDWRALMQPVREVVWECVKEGWAEVTQGGEVRQWEQRDELKGPIRVRRGKGFEGHKDDSTES